MGTISSGVGLISGIDTASLIEQLIAIEARGKTNLQQRVSSLQAQQTAMLDINARLLNMKNAAEAFRQNEVFQSAGAASSNESVLTASASAGAIPGNYTFIVDRLVTTSQLMTRGFADADSSGLGMSEISFEVGRGKLERDTELATLNGGDGVQRGEIRITDAAGGAAVIDLSRVGEVGEVVDAINASDAIAVSAEVRGDGIVLTDNSGGGGMLRVEDLNGGATAADLGILGDDGGSGTLTGSAINMLGGATALSRLNDGNGVLINTGLNNADFTITDRLGNAHDIVLGQYDPGDDLQEAATTIQDVVDRINDITGGAVTASIAADGVSLQLTDTTGGGGNLSVTGAGSNGDATARDLGILNAGVASDTIDGGRILAGLDSVLTRNLNGGSGLNGATTVTIQDRSGASVTINDADTYESLSDLVGALNDAAEAAGVSVTVGLNDSGNGLSITDTSGGGGNLIVSGDAATELGIATDPAGVAADTLRGDNLQHRYVSGSSLLSELNYGRGIGTGSFRVTDANGESAVVDIGSDSKTLQNVIDEINSKGLDINARVNDTGDGLLIEDTSTDGTLAISVQSVSGSTARDLGILGEADDPDTANFIDGSFERTVALEATDTLSDVASKINGANVPLSASIVNTGSGGSPFRLTFTSEITGKDGDIIVDAGNFDLGMRTLSEGKDARVFFGSTDPANAVLINSGTNTLDGVIEDVNIDLVSASSSPVTLTVSRDVDAIVKEVKNFVTTFNDAMGRINEYDKFDQETETKGVLLGDPTVGRVRSALFRQLTEPAEGVDSQFQFLSQVGIRTGSGSKLEFDETKFREALESDFDAVVDLFTAFDKEVQQGGGEELPEGVEVDQTTDVFNALGVAEQFVQLLDDLTNSVDGTLKRADESFERRIELTKDRIEAFDLRLEAKRERLRREFAAMESALARLQGQQNALGSLASNVVAASAGLQRGR